MKRSLLHFISWLLFMLTLSTSANGQDDGYRVWIKISPCSGRFDWVTVAKTNPGGGQTYYYLANQIFPGAGCTLQGCPFQTATAVAASLRTSNEFFKYCCRDYSVWQNTQTRQMAVVVGQYGTGGLGWQFVRGNLCCEEAEALSGIIGACSGNSAIQQAIRNAKCMPGTYAFWNTQTQRVECNCNPGLVWNNTRTACITPQAQKIDCSGYPGSVGFWNQQTGRAECMCPEGKTWNSTRTACVDVVQQATCPPGSYAAVNPQTGRTECYCNQGLVWNSNKTACVTPDCSGYPGSVAAWNTQTQRVECQCPQGKTWNSARTACVDVAQQVNCPPGSYAGVNPQTGKTECYCNPGLVWSSAKGACVTPGTENNNGGTRWTLVSVTATPTPSRPQWTYSTSSAHLNKDGYKADFTWTALPQQFTYSGITTTLSVQSNIDALIVIDGIGLSSQIPSADQNAYVKGTAANPATAQKSVTFTPSSTTTDVEIRIRLMWGEVTYSYKYQKSP